MALLPTGEQPAYANMDASMRWWWDNTIIPLEDSFADDIETQLFLAFGLNNTDWRIVWGRSQVPALREDEQARHSMIAADFKSGIIDRDEARVALGYESNPKYRGKFAVEAKAAETGTADDAELKANWREWLHRRGKSTPGTNSGSFTSGADAKPGVFQNSGAFDASHQWYGDLIPPESKEIQDAKHRLFQKLLPYARAGANEAGAVILERNGQLYRPIAVGTPAGVLVPVPIDEAYINFHTHDENISASIEDIHNILSREFMMQSHILTPRATLSYHKPPGWKLDPIPTLEKLKEEADGLTKEYNRMSMEWGIMYEVSQLNSNLQSYIVKEICHKYDILMRTGIRY